MKHILATLLLLQAFCCVQAQLIPEFFAGNTWSTIQNPAYCGLDNAFSVSTNTVVYPHRVDGVYFDWNSAPYKQKLGDCYTANLAADYRFSEKRKKSMGIMFCRDNFLYESNKRLDISYAQDLRRTANGCWRFGLQVHVFNYEVNADKLKQVFPSNPVANDISHFAYGLSAGIIRQYKNFTAGLTAFNFVFKDYYKDPYYRESIQPCGMAQLNYKHGKSVRFEHHAAISYVYQGNLYANLSSVATFRHVLIGLTYLTISDQFCPVIGYKAKCFDIRLSTTFALSSPRYIFKYYDGLQLSASYFIK